MTKSQVKSRVWKELSHEPVGTLKFSPALLAKLEVLLSDDQDFWSDLLNRHGLADSKLSDLDPKVAEHALSNFWCMLYETAFRHGLVE